MNDITPGLAMSAYFLGRRIAGQRRKPERVPVAYLYNGVRLPALPEVDGKPKAYMTKHTIFGVTKYQVHLLYEPYYAVSSDGVYSIGYRSGDVEYTAKESDIEWVYSATYQQNGVFASIGDVLWANFKVLDENGTEVPVKSDPVTVYE